MSTSSKKEMSFSGKSFLNYFNYALTDFDYDTIQGQMVEP
jgi:hypothetical protein